jgi:hypothetical protein
MNQKLDNNKRLKNARNSQSLLAIDRYIITSTLSYNRIDHHIISNQTVEITINLEK